MTICDKALLRKFVEDRAALDEAERHLLTLHLQLCESCNEEAAGLDQIQGALLDCETWPNLDDPSIEANEGLRLSTAHIESILRLPAWRWLDAARSDTRIMSPAGVRLLLTVADSAYDNLPSRNLEICTLAAVLADEVSKNAPLAIPDLRFEAWKDRATAHRRTGSHSEALRCIGIARAAAHQTTDEREHFLGVADFAEAIILTEMERYEEATRLLLRSRSQFAESDLRRHTATFWQDAIIAYRQGETERGMAIYETLIAAAITRGDERELADLYGNVALLFADTNPWLACEYLAKSIALDRGARPRRRVSELRNTATLGKLLARVGRLDEAVTAFQTAEDGYREIGMASSLVKVTLNGALARAARGDTDLLPIFQQLATDATRMSMPVTLAHVVGELHRIAARQQMSGAVLDYTLMFLDDIDAYPSQPFIPPLKSGVGI